jgi:hypothetical protein
VKKSLWYVCMFVLCSTMLLAQHRQGPRAVSTTESSAIRVPPQEAPASLRKIFSNLGKPGTDLYLPHRGWLVMGPNSVDQPQEFIGMRFIPKFDSHVSQVRAALQYFGSGANRVRLSLYADSSGTPGTLLAGPVTITDLPIFGTCCTLASADFAPVAVTAGTPYWVVADTPLNGNGSDSTDTWNFVVPEIPQAFTRGDGWFLQDENQSAAGDVRGTIP